MFIGQLLQHIHTRKTTHSRTHTVVW